MERAQKIFAERRLRFGRFIFTNDPKESKDWKFTLVGGNADELLQTPSDSLSSQFSSALKTGTKLACFSTDSGPLTGDHTRDLHRRGFSKSRMWTQYADKHAGVCLVLDKERLERQIASQIPQSDEFCGGLVEYVNRYFVAALEEGDYQIDIHRLNEMGFDRYLSSHRAAFSRRLFFEKMSDWCDENEFRWVVFSQTESDLYIDITGSLVGVLFGDRVADSQVEHALCNLPLDTQVMGLKWKNCSAWYDFGALRYNREYRAERGAYCRQ